MNDKQTTALVIAALIALLLYLNNTGKLPFIWAIMTGSVVGGDAANPGSPTAANTPGIAPANLAYMGGFDTGMRIAPLLNNQAYA